MGGFFFFLCVWSFEVNRVWNGTSSLRFLIKHTRARKFVSVLLKFWFGLWSWETHIDTPTMVPTRPGGPDNCNIWKKIFAHWRTWCKLSVLSLDFAQNSWEPVKNQQWCRSAALPLRCSAPSLMSFVSRSRVSTSLPFCHFFVFFKLHTYVKEQSKSDEQVYRRVRGSGQKCCCGVLIAVIVWHIKLHHVYITNLTNPETHTAVGFRWSRKRAQHKQPWCICCSGSLTSMGTFQAM